MQKNVSPLPSFTICAIRSYLAVIFLLPLSAAFDKLSLNEKEHSSSKRLLFTKSEIISGSICGAILFIASNFQQIGIGEGTDAGKASFITALYIVIVPVYSLIFGKKSPFNVWVSVGIAVIGFYLLCIKQDASISLSDLLVFLCALTFAMQIIAIDLSLAKGHTDGVRLSCVQFFVAGTLALICALIFEREQNVFLIFNYIPELLYLGVLSSGVGYTLQIIGQKHTPPAIASLVLSLESVFGAIAGSLVLGEKMATREYIGCAVIFAAVILSQLEFKRNKSNNRQSAS